MSHHPALLAELAPGNVLVGPWPEKTLTAEPAPHVHTLEECSPLYGHTQLSGRIVTDPAEIAAIRRRVESGVRPGSKHKAMRRLFRRFRGGA